MKKRLILTWIMLLGGGLPAAIATQTFNYQGQLTDTANFPVNGAANFGFQIWDSAVGGTSLWSNAQSGVPVNQGLFNVELPVGGALTGTQLNGNLWLEVTVNGQIMSPRKQLQAGIFSLNANMLQGLQPNNLPNNIPVLDGAGKLLPSVVSAPFPLLASGVGAGYAIYGANSNNVAGQSGVQGTGYNGLSGTATGAQGAGVYGGSASGLGVQAATVGGVALRGDANGGGALALSVSNPAGLGALSTGIYGLAVSAFNTGLRVGGGAFSGAFLSSPPLGIDVYSTGMGLSVNNTGANYAVSAVNNSSNFAALRGKNPNASGVGVFGENTQASSGSAGFGIGVYGSSNSAGGKGVMGDALASSGSNAGVYGGTASPGGAGVIGAGPNRGVQGLASAATGQAVYGLAQGADSKGVVGESSGTGASYGVQGLVASPSGAGVLGQGPGYGVWGNSSGAGAGAYGVYGSGGVVGSVGESLNPSGSAWGLLGRSSSADGIGTEGNAAGAGLGTRIGVMGRSQGLGGQAYGVFGLGANVGVFGQAGGAGGDTFGLRGLVTGSGDNRFGVYGTVNAAPGELVYGVFGEMSDANNSGYGVVGSNSSPSGRGVLATNTGAQTSAEPGYALGVEGKFKVVSDNAGHVNEPAGASQVRWTIGKAFCGVNDTVLLFPRFNINIDPSGAHVENAIWVESVADGAFVIATEFPVKGVFNYLVLDYLVVAK